MTITPDHEDLKAAGREVISASAGNVLIEWRLSRAPNSEWTQFLTTSGVPKMGSLSFVMTEPRVVHDRVRITVPDGDLESAVRWVEASIAEANEKYRLRVLPRLQQEAERVRALQVAERSQLDSARERLRQLNEPGLTRWASAWRWLPAAARA
jgi:hypothetical protein